MNKRNTLGTLFVLLILISTLSGCGYEVGKRNVSIYLDRAYGAHDNKIVAADEAKSSHNHGHFFFKTNGHFYYEALEKSDDEDTHAFMKGKYHKDGKNLIVLNVTWLGYYDIKHFKYEDSSSQLVDNKNDTYYKSYMKLDDSGNITSIVDYHDGYKTGGKLAKSGKPVDNGRIEDPVYLYKSEKYALKH